ncbi:MAG: HPF/RaiA family ribosome-associated protein [Planctomycetota bacterium]|nr:HPF/RaiA family ribosome-associated protein [Planctomycetota bacterium]
MNINVRHSTGIPSLGLVEQVARRLSFALERFSDRVSSVRVFLQDANGPRGGRDLTCRVVARIHGIRDIIIKDVDQDLEPLLSRIADRLFSNVGRRLKRLHNARRRIAWDANDSVWRRSISPG